MRILGRIVILITVFVMLQACASTRIAEQLQSGKVSFEDGNFKSAFHKLLPLASEGNAAAEYAVGYMYYYGYGTTQDTESGLFWMNKAAEQKYEQAEKALAIIKQNKVSPEPIQQMTAERSVAEDSDEVLHALADSKSSSSMSLADDQTETLAKNLPSAKPERVDPEDGESTKQLAATDEFAELNDAMLANNQAIAKKSEPVAAGKLVADRQPADFNEEHKKKYTLQLMGSYDLADLKRMQSRLHIEDRSYCANLGRNGRDWYVLGYGRYPAPYLAKLAMDDLPPTIREMKPWVRELDDVKVVV
jgi:septal ring-binding cell division protein DamX